MMPSGPTRANLSPAEPCAVARDRLRIGILCSNYPPHPGGLEIVVQSLAEGFASANDVVVATAGWLDAVGIETHGDLTIHRLPAVHRSEDWGVPYPFPYGPGLRAALRAVRDADVLHCHGSLYPLSIAAAIMARRKRVPLVVTEHVGFVDFGNPALNAIQRAAWAALGDFVIRSASAVTTYNSRVLQWLADRYQHANVRFIPNGVDLARFRPHSPDEKELLRRSLGLPEDRTLVLFVGRNAGKKNLKHVLRIPRTTFELVVCGAERRLPDDDVIDLGVVPYERMPGLLACADMMVHASTGEGFPVAVQEACAAGLPVALLWDDGYAESLDREIVAAANTLDELSSTVLRLVGDPEERAMCAHAQRLWAETHWRWQRTIDRYASLYRELIA
ncbi:MAG: glycosyltransferase family 4 protein [Gemmatimonadetes bacterium]|nr:glycosyltransferase family 4 protein [Gemmatimonadota bacterium]